MNLYQMKSVQFKVAVEHELLKVNVFLSLKHVSISIDDFINPTSVCLIVSINYQRESENREKEKEMKEAIEDWRKLDMNEFKRLVTKEQVWLYNSRSLSRSSTYY